jgi:hypothetical protein
MGHFEKLIHKLLSGTSDGNIDFDELCSLLIRLNFKVRIKGSHHIFYRDGIIEIINIQSNNGKAKIYQVKQIRNIVVKYKLVQDETEI